MAQPEVELPAPLKRAHLADLAREIAAAERLQPVMVEKDYYLTRLIWAIAQVLGERALLRGGTLLSKVDLGFLRMSEDVDLVLPGSAASRKRTNALRVNELRGALVAVAESVGVTLPFPHGERSERDAHAQWTLRYESDFGPQQILVEATLRPRLQAPRRTLLKQLLGAELSRLQEAYCWALDEDEARAEKVRAAFTRRAIRDYYDLDSLAEAGKDFNSVQFVRLVDAKLAELDAPPLLQQPPGFGMTDAERNRLIRAAGDELRSVLRVNAPPFDLLAVLSRFDRLWRV